MGIAMPSPRWSLAIAAAVTLAVGLAAVARPAAGAPGPTAPAGLARPASDHPDRLGPVAPIGGVVDGATGAEAERVAGVAAANFRKLAADRERQLAAGTPARATLDALHTAWGPTFSQRLGQGVHATHSVFTGAGATTRGNEFIYTPTTLSPGGACMEMTTAYTPSGPRLWAWDWCGGNAGVGKVVTMNQSFLSTYTTTVNGLPAYSTDVHKTDASTNEWTAYLFNFQTHAWDVFYVSSGTYDLSDPGFGWNIFEIYSSIEPATGRGYYCTDMVGRAFEASAIEVNINGTWQAATPANSRLGNPPAGSAFQCPSLTFSVVHANDHWLARIG